MAIRDTIPRQVTGATSELPKAIYTVGQGGGIAAYPTSAGTATVYVSCSPLSYCQADVASGTFSGGLAKWFPWYSGAVTAASAESVNAGLTAVAIVPASGTWTLEVTK